MKMPDKMPARKENIFITEFNTEKEYNDKIFTQIMDETRPSSPSNQSSWKFIRKLFKENKNGFKSLETPTESPNIPRKLRRSSLGDRGISTKPNQIPNNSNIGSHKKDNISATGKQRKISFGNNRKCSGTHSTENLLHYAVAEKDMNTLYKIFDSATIDVNYMRPPGLSPLHLACVAGHICVIKLLTENGADLKMKTWSGLTALQIANMFGHFEVAEYLLSKGADCRDIQNGVADPKLMIFK